MKIAIIGATGFIGSNLLNQLPKSEKFIYNSSNLKDILKQEFDIVYCAAPGAEKWKINEAPHLDLFNISDMVEIIKNVKTDKFVHFSTIDIFQNKETLECKAGHPYDYIDENLMTPYGRNRRMLEVELQKIFKENFQIFRLPGLFGPRLKKNFLFDLKFKKENLQLHNPLSSFQFYNINNLYNDIKDNKDYVINITSEPIKLCQINSDILPYMNISRPIIHYDVRYSSGYLYQKKSVLKDIKAFLND